MSNRGIDYSPTGSDINRDSETGIRYGIISVHEMTDGFFDDLETHYQARCPSCGSDLDDEFLESLESEDQNCPSCGVLQDTEDVYGDTPDAQTINREGIQAVLDQSNDVWIYSSPFYTRGVFCSPCAPGAVSIGSPCDDGAKAYCLPHTWYRDGVAPHPVYRVCDDAPVKVEANDG